MEMVATLLETGINMAKIYRTIFDVTTIEKTKLASRCLERLELCERINSVYAAEPNSELK